MERTGCIVSALLMALKPEHYNTVTFCYFSPLNSGLLHFFYGIHCPKLFNILIWPGSMRCLNNNVKSILGVSQSFQFKPPKISKLEE